MYILYTLLFWLLQSAFTQRTRPRLVNLFYQRSRISQRIPINTLSDINQLNKLIHISNRVNPILIIITYAAAYNQTMFAMPCFVRNPNGFMSSCEHSGTIEGKLGSSFYLNMCNGGQGIIRTLNRVCRFQTEINDWKLIQTVMCTHPKHHRVRRQTVHAPVGANSSSEYVELYVVLDKAFVDKASDHQRAIARAKNILKHAAGLMQKLNIYLIIRRIEAWSTGDMITILENINNTIIIARDFSNHYLDPRRTSTTSSDIHILLSAVNYVERIAGRARGTICSPKPVAVVRDYINGTDDYVKTATIMSHEIGHILTFDHTNATYCGCLDPISDIPTNCIMHVHASHCK